MRELRASNHRRLGALSFIWVLSAFLFLRPMGFLAQRNAASQKDAKPQSAPTPYINQECGFELKRLPDWNVMVTPDPHPTRPCELIATFSRRSTDKSVEKHSANLFILAKEFESALRDAGLVQKDGEWMMEGRQGSLTPTWEIHGATWTGLQGNQLVGCFDANGYSGLGESPSAVVTDTDKATKSAVIYSGTGDCDSIDLDGFNLLLHSFEFVH